MRAFVGHGVGKELHEDPEVPNYGHPGRGPRLVPGMCIAIEPMVNQYKYDVKTLGDGWTVKTCDGAWPLISSTPSPSQRTGRKF